MLLEKPMIIATIRSPSLTLIISKHLLTDSPGDNPRLLSEPFKISLLKGGE